MEEKLEATMMDMKKKIRKRKASGCWGGRKLGR
jgi:hypothetical protein